MNSKQQKILNNMPIVAILRGVETSKIIDIAAELVLAGIRIIEIPLNCPNALQGIRLLQENFSEHIIFGGGTVLNTQSLEELHQLKAEMIVAPNTNTTVIKESLAKNMIPVPGFATPTEAFQAIDAGARHLKLFPASFYGPKYIKALRAVIPSEISIFAVGGVHPGNMKEWLQAGATGFGICSALYQPGFTAKDTAEMAQEVVAAFRQARQDD
ncbi:2-dehydro-3-deoxy-6-phosphogalactonate aldolase [Candidatus Uabimicrobium amorphum]|uniref:2-dehydro-3-deoxy-6-phosphogalactonate aldolase n=1 Tax=Uabimicrobium amorphum TaxID=2596890 RepID=A0A5S9IU58_UABAM|nr:2-dehydro-3-deoxy-6-phosphogalactonate aldolase [Candidatus Uabimicrobium amorphum]BBM87210.1 2-dehydro-3-deoxy-6-phosphogalactonate aldolase [Candidatus Uabimicrobium amorphum]